jgi:hypothetical protein
MSQRSLLVFYDLADPARNREALVQKIKSYGPWARLGAFAYLIRTDQPPAAVRDGLKTVLGEGDRLFVTVSSRPAAWRGLPEAVSKWILANQK